MTDSKNTKKRALSLLKTIGSTAVKAGNEALRKKFNMTDDDFSVSAAALRLTKGLDELKGAAMKIGQMISMMDDTLLPKGWKEALSKLQSQATARDWREIEPILWQELGSLEAFAEIDPVAVYAASIAQVHKATLKNGKKVAVKIQYPDLEKNIDSDLQSMKKLIKVANIMPNMANYDHIFLAAELMFKQELDFEREKNFYQLYHDKFNKNENVIVPQPIEKLCTKRVLVTEWIDGINLQTWIEQNPDKQIRDQLGALMLEVIFTEIFFLNQIQSDPNPGNFLVTPDHKLVLLDFGATQKLSSELVDNYVHLIQAGLDGKRNDLFRYAKKMGFLLTGDSDDVRESFARILDFALEPFFEEKYSWEHCYLTKKINTESLVFMKLTKFRAPSGEVLFMNRRLAGNLMLMEKMGSEFSARPLFLKLLNQKKQIQSEMK